MFLRAGTSQVRFEDVVAAMTRACVRCEGLFSIEIHSSSLDGSRLQRKKAERPRPRRRRGRCARKGVRLFGPDGNIAMRGLYNEWRFVESGGMERTCVRQGVDR